ncbi:hypothetical protein [Bacillus tropicus]|uniref:hypothetical protein n=1 Tax=Bacillus tropicus TaxID=2026188 RepID=UPI003D1F823D
MNFVIIMFSLLVSTILSVLILRNKNNKWLGMLSAFLINTLILVIATWVLHRLDDEARRLWCKALIHDNVIDNEVMGWSNLLWKPNWIYLNGSNMNQQSFY